VDNINSSELAVVVKKYSHFFEEIRKRVLFTLFFFLFATIVGFIYYEDIIRFLIKALGLEKINIVFTSPFQFINLAVSCGLVTGFVFIVPLIIFQILLFLKPALKAKEFKSTVRSLPPSIILFMAGFVFGILAMKWQVELFLEKSLALNIGNILDISGILTTALLTGLIMGLGFQLPIILLFLMNIGIVDRQQLIAKRSWVYLGSFIFAMFLPLDSILADILLALPFVLLYEGTLLLNLLITKSKVRK